MIIMEYKITQYLSSREFYKMLFHLENIVTDNDVVILDFTEVRRIDAVVIPNLLLLGTWIEEKSHTIPYIRLGDDISAGTLKSYLAGINFYELSNSYFMYENEEEKYSGLFGKKMDKRNTTQLFEYKSGLDVAKRRICYNLAPFMRYYLNQFVDENEIKQDSRMEYVYEDNILGIFVEELIENSFVYGECDAIVTVQANYNKKRIYLSVSDSGDGMLKRIKEQINKTMEKVDYRADKIGSGYNVLKKMPSNELESIWIALYKRVNSNIHGLYNVVKRVLLIGGTVRIHSNNTQLILTPRLYDMFIKESLVLDKTLNEFNTLKTVNFKGVHIEIDIPLEEGGGRDANY